MGAAYQILGRTFQPHQLAIATLSLLAIAAAPNPFAAKKTREVELNASSKEEEKFIKEYLEKHI
ncbi:ATP synthase subunit K, mitochondrial [Nakaseomyces bracarensis]|uniref:ATP synthase subunit K, mitochondrial n=1 Tax=Nakaseomyces bracarensis TaxID=273131 RepID=A0ABR4NP71_9SACH